MISASKRTLSLLASAAFALLAAVPCPVAGDDAQFIKHESREGGYSIDLPLDWDVKTSLKDWDCVAFAPKTTAEAGEYLDTISISLLNGELAATAESLTASLKAKSPAFSLLSSKELKASGSDAIRLEYAYESGAVKIRAVTLLVAEGPRVWAATFSGTNRSFIARKSLFDKVESSFKVLNNGTN